MSQGYFITFEGLDGSGKSTQLRLLAASLARQGYPVVSTRNPGGTALGDSIRGLLLDSGTDSAVGGLAPETEMALMFADRAQSLHQVIRPALAAGTVVLCDRYTDSSEAYQGAGRELGPERILALHQAICQGQQPDLTVLLQPPLAVCLARARHRNQRHLQAHGTDENRFEQEGEAFYTRVHAQYQRIADREPRRVLLLGEDASIERIADLILSAVLHRLYAPPSSMPLPRQTTAI